MVSVRGQTKDAKSDGFLESAPRLAKKAAFLDLERMRLVVQPAKLRNAIGIIQ